MSLQRFAQFLVAVLIGLTALLGGTGVARADPEDATPPIIDDMLAIPGFLAGPGQDPRSLDTPNNFGVPGQKDWTGSGMFCQNRNAKCQKMGF
ncbi:hypothetical protein BST27_14200 [Mycobacterium intermedium]|uniref:DUF732 domain-containing protein n=1 Tax=Mycobacterium intermedium TaxID=28445 RepID=A0A1E3SB34_MYCIE|nr:hypothetical protein [Mycobacterium intermedium]MCV6966598.1 hypothetical protein [Mycobacterium intermedium]ODQ98787.1 hypothetical protein BHQ20_20400 [Mycobacterium intermedium]OPE49850.1 hypothetical protein BV508_12445 [Mycobacterium intermedium]ORB04677.1 hypothetical protein BST27_14200 [Mycobacterium intermedium]